MIGSLVSLATSEHVQRLLPLATAPEPFLTCYMDTPRSDVTFDGARLRAASMLDHAEHILIDTAWAETFAIESAAIEDALDGMKVGGPALFMASCKERGFFESMRVALVDQPDQLRFGRGLHVLPLVDLLDELEPAAFALMEKATAKVFVFDGRHILIEHHIESDVPKKHKQGGLASPRIQRAHFNSAMRYIDETVDLLDRLLLQYKFRRLFIGGPDETAAMTKKQLSHPLTQVLRGMLAVDAHAGNEEIRQKVLAAAIDEERRDELETIKGLIVQAEKGHRASLGRVNVMAALERGETQMLYFAQGLSWPAIYCISCDAVFGSGSQCGRCGARTMPVGLAQEFPRLAMMKGARIEIVHGSAARELLSHGGVAALHQRSER